MGFALLAAKTNVMGIKLIHNSEYRFRGTLTKEDHGMGQPKLNVEYSEPYLSYADVMDKEADGFILCLTGQHIKAQVAASCIIQPEIGDHVLVAVDGFSRCFILSNGRQTLTSRPVALPISSSIFSSLSQ